MPVDDMAELAHEPGARPSDGPDRPVDAEPRASIWPHVHPRLLELIRAHHTTLIFCNARRMAERLAAHLNDLAGEELVRAHHGSLSREQRLVSRVRPEGGTAARDRRDEQPRARHRHGQRSTSSCSSSHRARSRAACNASAAPAIRSASRAPGKIFPKYRGDLLEADGRRAAHARRSRRGDALPAQPDRRARAADRRRGRGRRVGRRRALRAGAARRELRRALGRRVPRGARHARRPLPVGSVRRPAAPRRVGPRAGPGPRTRRRAARRDRERRHDSRPRAVRRVPPRRRARRRARRGDGLREPRRRDVRARRDHVAHRGDHVRPCRRHARAGRARQDAVLARRPSRPAARARPRARRDGARAARRSRADRPRLASAPTASTRTRPTNLRRYLDEQGEVDRCRPRRPHDRHRAVPRRDRRLARLHPHAVRLARARALGARARGAAGARRPAGAGAVVATTASSCRLPEAIEDIPLDLLLFDPDEVEELVVERLPSTSLFASRFRENAARALLLPRRRPGERTPLWQQRQRAADLLEVASGYPSFPMLLETTRECLRDVFDLPALREVLADIRSRKLRVVPVETQAGVTVRAVAAVRLDRRLHVRGRRAARRTPRGRARARPRPAARPARRRGAARAARPGGARRARARAAAAHARAARRATPTTCTICSPTSARWTTTSSRARTAADPRAVARRAARRSAASIRVGDRFAAAEDAARLRDALGIALPAGLPDRVHRPGRAAARRSRRALRPHARPFIVEDVAGAPRRPGRARARDALARLEADGRVVHGEFRPGGIEREWCDASVLRTLRRRSLAALRHEIEPVDAPTFARFLPAWQGVGRGRRGLDALVETLEQLQGVAIPASVLERDVLPARVDGYRPTMLDELCAAGELVWVGAGPLGADDGRVRLLLPRSHPPARARRPSPTAGPTAPCTTRSARRLARGRRVVLARSRRGRRHRRRGGRAHRAVGSRVGRRGHQRHVRSAARAARAPPSARPRGAAQPRRGCRGSVRRRARVAGRSSRRCSSRRPTPTEIAHAQALQLLERHGVVTREGVRAEGVPGGFAARVLRCCARSRSRAAPAGAGSSPGSAPRSSRCPAPSTGCARTAHAERDERRASSCSRRTDPAQPYGAALAWPEHAAAGRARAAGAHVVLVDGELAVYLERGGKSLAHLRRASDAARLGRRARRGAQGGPPRPAPARAHRRRAGAHVAGRAGAARRGLRRRVQGPDAADLTSARFPSKPPEARKEPH